MAKELVTDELWEVIEPLLPEEPAKPKGGRPRIDDRHLVCAKEWHSVGDVAPGDGLRFRDDLLWLRLKDQRLLDRLGEADQMVERTLSWLNRNRLLKVRYEQGWTFIGHLSISGVR